MEGKQWKMENGNNGGKQDGALKYWIRIPNGSTLNLSLKSTDSNFVGSARLARLVKDDGSDEKWPHNMLVPGPKRLTLQSPHYYVIRVRVEFMGADLFIREPHLVLGGTKRK